MRASNTTMRKRMPIWAFAVAATLSMGVSGSLWAQDEVGEAPQPPTPPAPVVAPEPVEKEATKQVRILRQGDGSLRIHARDENGETANVEIDLGEEFGGAVTRRIYEKLKEKGVLDEQGLVIEESLESVPRNIDIGISTEMAREHARQAREHARAARDLERKAEVYAYNYSDSDDSDIALVIPVIAILAVFGTPILIVWLVTRNSYRKKQLVMENINRMVSEGRDIPPELLDALEGESTGSTRDRGFTLMAVGAAIFIWLTAAAGVGVGSLGLIPLFIGVARYINWKLDHQQAG
ncbi:DUF6249 domain-containing protein [Microbulbifer bruguierae]|uniref:DUF6249 domain-containing protein n=1 Tax=Microbulbifer bruguierae TaxID=3029061 RepID=A0ABY8ND60_9GAMM|nr:DUF6249 domain-containing protein [Microbulbifer bruguierae]WGL16861.1 DUF6249 domain-containing protein [Microbulbifer bruguierae]